MARRYRVPHTEKDLTFPKEISPIPGFPVREAMQCSVCLACHTTVASARDHQRTAHPGQTLDLIQCHAQMAFKKNSRWIRVTPPVLPTPPPTGQQQVPDYRHVLEEYESATRDRGTVEVPSDSDDLPVWLTRVYWTTHVQGLPMKMLCQMIAPPRENERCTAGLEEALEKYVNRAHQLINGNRWTLVLRILKSSNSRK